MASRTTANEEDIRLQKKLAQRQFLPYIPVVKLFRTPMALLLPLTEVLVWVLIVPVPITIGYMNLVQASHGTGQVSFNSGEFGLTVLKRHFLHFAVEGIGIERSHLITALNAPGMVGEILISLPTSWPSTCHPKDLDFETWRTLTLPFFALPAWWLVGLGLDALLGRTRLHWLYCLAGSILCLCFVILLLGLRFGLAPAEREGLEWLTLGLALWSLLFAVLPLGWILQRRAKNLQQ